VIYRDHTLACPECGVELVAHDTRRKWRCKQCSGVLAGVFEIERDLGEQNRHLLLRAPQTRAGMRPCPACRVPMQPVRIADDPAIEVDRCIDDGLVWFDRGELGRIRAELASRPGDPNITRIIDRLLA
jgi:Zn-finger nucleic acid-binding protein